jgi:hypothetical protein
MGSQNFHDIRQEICPAYLTDDQSSAALPRDYAAWPVIMAWTYESRNFYEWVELASPMSFDNSLPGSPSGNKLVRSVSCRIYFCPARRDPPQFTSDGACTVGDYACVSRAFDAGDEKRRPNEPRTWDAAMVVCRAFNPGPGRKVIAGVELEPGDFRSLTNFASVIDGLSNTIFFGEKAVRADRFGGHATNPATTIQADQQDGTYYYGGLSALNNLGDLRAPGAISFWSRRLAADTSGQPLLPAKPRSEDPANRFGGWHKDVTLFVMGDGSVRALSNDTSNAVLERLGRRNDGRAPP